LETFRFSVFPISRHSGTLSHTPHRPQNDFFDMRPPQKSEKRKNGLS
jgi:hypothetical protein